MRLLKKKEFIDMKNSKKENVLVLGASSNRTRYSNLASQMLVDYEHSVYAYGNRGGEIGDLDIKTKWPTNHYFDTITMYLNPKRQEEYWEQIILLKPQRVIFNPGTENPDFYKALKGEKIEVVEACTLVLLRTNQF